MFSVKDFDVFSNVENVVDGLRLNFNSLLIEFFVILSINFCILFFVLSIFFFGVICLFERLEEFLNSVLFFGLFFLLFLIYDLFVFVVVVVEEFILFSSFLLITRI